MSRDPKYRYAERPDPAWVPLTQDALEERAFALHARLEYDAAWGITTLRHGGVTFYAVTRKFGGVA